MEKEMGSNSIGSVGKSFPEDNAAPMQNGENAPIEGQASKSVQKYDWMASGGVK